LTNLKYGLYRSMWSALDLLFPPQCGGCNSSGSRWCEDCQRRVNVLTGILCDVCGLPQEVAGVCATCRVDRPHFHSLRAWAVFETPIQNALHKLKYRHDMSMGEAIAGQMKSFVKNLNWHVDMIVPVPLGVQRLRERGYNQVAMIAKPLSMALDYQYAPDVLMRQKETRSQVGLNKEERRKNMHAAFRAGSGVKDKTVLIMDDVSTTGSTLSASAEALYFAGAKDVYALTVARALPHHDMRHV